MQTLAFTMALYFTTTFELKNYLANGKSKSTFRNFPNVFFKGHRQWRKVRKVVVDNLFRKECPRAGS